MSEGQPDGKEKYLVGEDNIQRDLSRGEKKILESVGYKIEKPKKDEEKGVFGISKEVLKKAEEEHEKNFGDDQEHYWDK